MKAAGLLLVYHRGWQQLLGEPVAGGDFGQRGDAVRPGRDQKDSSAVLSHLRVVSCRSDSCRNFF